MLFLASYLMLRGDESQIVVSRQVARPIPESLKEFLDCGVDLALPKVRGSEIVPCSGEARVQFQSGLVVLESLLYATGLVTDKPQKSLGLRRNPTNGEDGRGCRGCYVPGGGTQRGSHGESAGKRWLRAREELYSRSGGNGRQIRQRGIDSLGVVL